MTAATVGEAAVVPRDWRRLALYLLLGFAAGLPFYMFSTVLSLRLQAQSKAIDPSETHFVEMLSCARRRIMAISARPSRFTSSPRPLEQ